ncbi:MAG: biotin--[acetyl-CoA-carboxylase] ligase [Pelagibacteraceae bacterium]|jgi:BirA family transcriptional regulator, biotin operon repressor / biotin---[acetyl-CoA-carboxylase] ligase|nr:biotin--[acetyl-CoA-carboxylase] ligase [Pelagibacteraceae bacterium]
MKLKITKFKSVKSTNDKAIKLIQLYNRSSGLIISDIQTKGRGTMGKKWISKKGNIFISIFYKVNFSNLKIKNFLVLNAKIIKKILQTYTKKNISVKKPNDLLIEKKKFCGILQEVIEHNNEKFLITGIGINTLIVPNNNEFSATSLSNHAKKNIKNLKVIKKIKNIYEKMIYDLTNNNFTYVKKKYI